MAQLQNRYFAVVSPGFEEICLRELAGLNIPDATVTRGGVEFCGGLKELYLANLWLRSASRVLVRVGEVSARDFPTLYKRLVRLPWGRFVKPGSDCTVRVSCHRSRLSHSGRVAETCLAAINKALGPGESTTASTLYLRLDDDCCQVSIDSSGELLHRRGYRAAKVAAPLRENLAAGCLLALGYDGSVPLVDGMTGSGTFALEAALIALNRAPGKMREFAFMQWPKYRQGLWKTLLHDAERAERPELNASITGIDNNPKAIAAATQNLATAGLSERIKLDCRSIQDLEPESANGLLICNPPYGERLGRTAALQALYKDMGRVYGDRFSHWQGALVCPDSDLMRRSKICFQPLLKFSNGGIRVALLEKAASGSAHEKNLTCF